MTKIHPTAVVSPRAEIGPDCEIGPHVVIEDDVVIGARNRILANAVICSGTTMGSENEVHFGAVLGHVPQHKHFDGKPTLTRIGSRNVFRENCQVHRGTVAEATVIGDDNLLMALAHVAHDCVLENNIVICNNSLLAGHMHVESRVVISGTVLIHQFCRIGTLAMIGGLSTVNRDVPPYMMAVGFRPCLVIGLNTVGLRRAGFSDETRAKLRLAFRILYRSGLILPDAVQRIADLGGPEIEHLVGFIKKSKRGVLAGQRVDDEAAEENGATED